MSNEERKYEKDITERRDSGWVEKLMVEKLCEKRKGRKHQRQWLMRRVG